MIARIICTGAILLLGVGGFIGWAPVAPGPLNPFGIVCLALSGVIWFGWDMIQDAYAYREEIAPNNARAFLQTVRLGPVFVSRLVRKNTE
jgi:hypothetical protein